MFTGPIPSSLAKLPLSVTSNAGLCTVSGSPCLPTATPTPVPTGTPTPVPVGVSCTACPLSVSQIATVSALATAGFWPASILCGSNQEARCLTGGWKNGTTQVIGISVVASNLIGTIPSFVYDLSTLQSLVLSGNKLTGTIAPEISKLIFLQVLDLSNNRLVVPVPATLLTLATLKKVHFNGNSFTGLAPVDFVAAVNMTAVYIANNPWCVPDLTTVPACMDCTLDGGIHCSERLLRNELLSRGWITTANWCDGGKVVCDSKGNVVSLSFTGNLLLPQTIPLEIFKVVTMQSLTLSSFKFTTLSATIPSAVGALARLTLLHLTSSGIPGIIPSSVGTLTALVSLDLGRNALVNSIPSELGGLSGLTSLKLDDNQLTGSIPFTLGKLTGLSTLNLSRNRLTGTLPSVLAFLTRLLVLDVRYNKFTGVIPVSLSVMPRLTELFLTDNCCGSQSMCYLSTVEKPWTAFYSFLTPDSQRDVNQFQICGNCEVDYFTAGPSRVVGTCSSSTSPLPNPSFTACNKPCSAKQCCTPEVCTVAICPLGSVPLSPLPSFVCTAVPCSVRECCLSTCAATAASLCGLGFSAKTSLLPIAMQKCAADLCTVAECCLQNPVCAPGDIASLCQENVGFAPKYAFGPPTARCASAVCAATDCCKKIAPAGSVGMGELCVVSSECKPSFHCDIPQLDLQHWLGTFYPLENDACLLSLGSNGKAQCCVHSITIIRKQSITVSTGSFEITVTFSGTLCSLYNISPLSMGLTELPLLTASLKLAPFTLYADLSKGTLIAISSSVSSIYSYTQTLLRGDTIRVCVPFTRWGYACTLADSCEPTLELACLKVTPTSSSYCMPPSGASISLCAALVSDGWLSSLAHCCPNKGMLGADAPSPQCEVFHQDGSAIIYSSTAKLAPNRFEKFAQSLVGTIPSVIGQLTSLTRLEFSDIKLSGTIPSSLGTLTALQTLVIANTTLMGTLPAELFSLVSLESLSLNGNRFTGQLLPLVGALQRLKSLYLHDNFFTGTVPSTLSQLTRLTALYLVDKLDARAMPNRFCLSGPAKDVNGAIARKPWDLYYRDIAAATDVSSILSCETLSPIPPSPSPTPGSTTTTTTTTIASPIPVTTVTTTTTTGSVNDLSSAEPTVSEDQVIILSVAGSVVRH